jgi:hypothetical protein
MRYFAIALCFTLGCQPSARRTTKRPVMNTASIVFTDSAMYRMRCKEADSLSKLAVIPQKCTPRDQRVEIR